MLRRLFTLFSAALALLLTAGCGGVTSQSSASPSADQVTGSLTVLAAASLTDGFNRIGEQFKAKHSGVDLKFSYAGSPTLVTQIQQGAPADVFASADQPNMQKVVDGGLNSGAPKVFARNKLQIVVLAGNPKGIKGLADLANPGTVVILCAPAVPCGNYANQAFTKAGIKVTARSQEPDVNAVVSKVSLGEADAGIVYVTDVKAAGAKVAGVDIPDAQNVVVSYPMATVKGGANPKGGSAFVDFVLSLPGQAILANYGFSKV